MIATAATPASRVTTPTPRERYWWYRSPSALR